MDINIAPDFPELCGKCVVCLFTWKMVLLSSRNYNLEDWYEIQALV